MHQSASGTERLKQAHSQAIKEVHQHINHWKRIKEDYSQLDKRLETLPDKMSYDVMVPFSPLAFIPGKLVHTNELLVHLGDSWFSEMTCKQGQKIIAHRMEAVDKSLADLDKTLKNFDKKTEFSKEVLSSQKVEGEDTVDIKEPIPNDYLHPSRRKRISRVKDASTRPKVKPTKTQVPERHSETVVENSTIEREQELMKRLNDIKFLDGEQQKEKTSSVKSETTVRKQVRFDLKSEAQTTDSTISIRFKHSEASPETPPTEFTPGDIGKQQHEKTEALSTTVREHTDPPAPDNNIKPHPAAPKRVSRFKAERNK